jgi:hypothetical protein
MSHPIPPYAPISATTSIDNWTDRDSYRAVLMTWATSRARRDWHAGAIDAGTAMRQLDTLLSVICISPSLRYVATNATGRVGFADVEASS